MKRYFETHFAYVMIYTFVALVGGYLIVGDSSWRIAACIMFAFACGVRLGFGEAVTRLKQIRPSWRDRLKITAVVDTDVD